VFGEGSSVILVSSLASRAVPGNPASNNSWAQFGRIAEGAKSGAKMALANHFFGFNIKQTDLFQVELDGDSLTQMK
jgi:hypothetical protein